MSECQTSEDALNSILYFISEVYNKKITFFPGVYLPRRVEHKFNDKKPHQLILN
jgi:hypothetical protein